MKTYLKTVSEIIDDEKELGKNKSECPLNISVIPNYMGINLVAVDSISWTRQDDGQLVNLTINFKPDNK